MLGKAPLASRHSVINAAKDGRHLSVKLSDLPKALSHLPAVVAVQHVESERAGCWSVRLDPVPKDLHLLSLSGH